MDYNTWALHQHLEAEYQAEMQTEREDAEFNRLESQLAKLLTQHGFEDVYDNITGSDVWVAALTQRAQQNLQSHCF
ncbi:hypothetical protein E4T80_11935 [Muribacter muris]|uniref:Uncharacterized protein n=1 Tax=Muribacter muris TaxID=67855 RepID=A0A4Y9JT85_9PAST|nr:hypothetical protein [Muribacter muris]MBF0786171.1 hypothetical protein [Muribacter muris]MBF0828298.1 hypothetical protein [Muribacter muris]TFV07695.1 hypothetical protein E4T80_11935 [Muribacter muris]